MAENSLFLIDLDKILREKAGKYYKYIPRFVISYLVRIVHQEEFNEFLTRVNGHEGVEFLKDCVEFLDLTLKVEGVENLPPASERCVFASNHAHGGLDGVALGYVLGEHYNGNIGLIVNDILMNLKGLAPLCVGVNKTGDQSRRLPAIINEAYDSDKQMFIFPAGICSRKIDGVVQDVPWQKSFVSQARRTHRDVVPIFFSGRNSDAFYRKAKYMKLPGMKFNPAMIYLPDEMMKNRHKEFTITFGKPVPWETFDKSKTDREWAQYVRGLVYEIAKNKREEK